MKRFLRPSPGVLVAIACALGSVEARAETCSTAHDCFARALELVKQHGYAEACPLFEKSQALEPALGTLYNLASCWEHLGRTASARATFLEVAEASHRSNEAKFENEARERALALAPKVPELVVEAESRDAGIEITRDGARMDAAQWGTRIAVDPGDHVLAARAPGKKPWQQTVHLSAEAKTTPVSIPPLEDEPTRLDIPTAAWVLAGVGAAGLVAGTAFGIGVMAKNKEADRVCPTGEGCSLETDQPAYDKAISQAKDLRTLSMLGFGVAGASLAAAVVVMLTSTPRSESGAARVVPTVAQGSIGASLTGVW